MVHGGVPELYITYVDGIWIIAQRSEFQDTYESRNI